MQVTSANFKDGDYLAMDHVLAEKYGFGCRQRLLALGRGQHPCRRD
jgi:hypothetical protein